MSYVYHSQLQTKIHYYTKRNPNAEWTTSLSTTMRLLNFYVYTTPFSAYKLWCCDLWVCLCFFMLIHIWRISNFHHMKLLFCARNIIILFYLDRLQYSRACKPSCLAYSRNVKTICLPKWNYIRRRRRRQWKKCFFRSIHIFISSPSFTFLCCFFPRLMLTVCGDN